MTQTKLAKWYGWDDKQQYDALFGVQLQAKICPWKRGKLEEDGDVAVPANNVPGK